MTGQFSDSLTYAVTTTYYRRADLGRLSRRESREPTPQNSPPVPATPGHVTANPPSWNALSRRDTFPRSAAPTDSRRTQKSRDDERGDSRRSSRATFLSFAISLARSFCQRLSSASPPADIGLHISILTRRRPYATDGNKGTSRRRRPNATRRTERPSIPDICGGGG